jgi:hypothetical protein
MAVERRREDWKEVREEQMQMRLGVGREIWKGKMRKMLWETGKRSWAHWSCLLAGTCFIVNALSGHSRGSRDKKERVVREMVVRGGLGVPFVHREYREVI